MKAAIAPTIPCAQGLGFIYSLCLGFFVVVELRLETRKAAMMRSLVLCVFLVWVRYPLGVGLQVAHFDKEVCIAQHTWGEIEGK